MEELILKTDYEVSTADVDLWGRLRPAALVNFLIQSAVKSADQLGFGFGNIQSQQLIWVLSRLEIEIDYCFKWYDVLTVETWPKDSERIFYYRDFIIKNSSGKIVGRASSAWLAVDANSKRPAIMQGNHKEYFEKLNGKFALDRRPRKLGKAILSESRIIKPVLTDFDVNQHITSTRYIDWIWDSIDKDFHQNHYPNLLVINYIKETKWEQDVKLNYANVSENIFAFSAEHMDTQKDSFKAEMHFNSEF